jgi:hypothetical protein
MVEGDIVYCKDTKGMFKVTSVSPSVVYEEIGAGGSGSANGYFPMGW